MSAESPVHLIGYPAFFPSELLIDPLRSLTRRKARVDTRDWVESVLGLIPSLTYVFRTWCGRMLATSVFLKNKDKQLCIDRKVQKVVRSYALMKAARNHLDFTNTRPLVDSAERRR